MKRFILLLTVMLLPLLGEAQTQWVPKPLTLVKAGRLFDPESGTYTANQNILIREGTIIAVGPDVKAPADATVYDLSHYTVMPGLIDAHSSLLVDDPVPQIDFRDALATFAREGTTYRAMVGLTLAREVLRKGITTVRQMGHSGDYGDVHLRKALQARFEGPRVLASGPALSPVNGLFREMVPEKMRNEEYRIVHGPDDAKRAVAEHLSRGVSLISVFADNSPNSQQLSADELQAIVQAAGNRALVGAIATKDDAAANAARAGVHTISHGTVLSDATLKLMVENNVTLVATDLDRQVLNMFWYRQRRNNPANDIEIENTMRTNGDRLRRALAAGVRVAFGSNMYFNLKEEGLDRGDASKHTLYAYVEEGVPNLQVLRMATINSAYAVGNPQLGLLKVGYLADIIAVDGDPLADIHVLDKIRFVMKDGHAVQ